MTPPLVCPYCNNTSFVKRGFSVNKKQRYFCKVCGKTFSINETDFHPPSRKYLKELVSANKDVAEITSTVNERVLNEQDLIRVCNIDTSIWEIERWVCNKWEVGVKTPKDGVEIKPLYQVKAWLRRKKEEILLKNIKEEIKDEIKKFSLKYPKIFYKKHKEKYLLEIDMPDLHFGKLAWNEESGEDYDIKIAEEVALDSLSSLINQSSVYTIDRILFPVGNDYFNVNNKFNTTVHNTLQQEDTRYQKTFKKGRLLAIRMIDMLSTIAPVDVVIVPGNHDEERTFYLGDSLECWYHNNPNVTVDNRAVKRKYYLYGKNLIGFTHGYYEDLKKLPLLMSLEQPEWWAITKFREWQTGDKHHKKEIFTYLREDESQGVMVRVLRALSATDTWHYDKGFVGAQRAAEAFVRHFENGLIAQFLSVVSCEKYTTKKD
uniref:IS1 family transposase n=1 Tax=Dictyoglomus turgidum TaxID=513050 RepID=A0A7C3WLN4_9BACT